jgi:hypothetical protein
MNPERHQILKSMVGGKLKLALMEITEEILAKDNARIKAGQDEKLATHNNQVATNETDLDAGNMKHADTPDILQFGEISENTAMPATDMYGQSLWPAAESKPSDEVSRAEAYLDAAGIKGNEQLNALAGIQHSDISSEDFEETNDQPTGTSPQFVDKTDHFEQRSLNPTQAAIDKSGDKFVSSKDNIIGSNIKKFLPPDQESELIFILTKMFDTEFCKGNYPFKQAARHVLELLREKFGSNVANQISIEHLQGAYIGMSARYKDRGADQACDVVAITNKSELEEDKVINKRSSTYLESAIQNSKVAYFMGDESIQERPNRISEIRKSGVQSNDGISRRDAVAYGEKSDLKINTGASNLSPSSAGNNVYQLSGSTVFDETSIKSDPATVTKVLAESGLTDNIVKINQAETDIAEQHHGLVNIKESPPILTEGKQEEILKEEKCFASSIDGVAKDNKHLDATGHQVKECVDAVVAMKSRFITAGGVREAHDQRIGTSAQSTEKTTENVHDVITVAQNQAINQLLSKNKLIALDKIYAARASIKLKLGTLNSKPDPELLIDGATMAVAYIEAGMRKYSAYTLAMINDFGNGIEPYLRDFYEGACYYLGLDSQTECTTFQTRGGSNGQ